MFSLIAQIGEQVDFLRFLPPRRQARTAELVGALIYRPVPAGSFPACSRCWPARSWRSSPSSIWFRRTRPPSRRRCISVGFQYVFSSPQLALAFTGAFVIISQIKINVTNAYAGSLAWSNFFSRLTHSHPGRVVWLVFNVADRADADGARHLQDARAACSGSTPSSRSPGSARWSPIS